MKAPQIHNAEITHDNTSVKIEYVFEGLDQELRIVKINNAPDYFFDKKTLADIEYTLTEQMISEGVENREYLAEMRGDEERGN